MATATLNFNDYLQNPHSIDVLLCMLELTSQKKAKGTSTVIFWHEVHDYLANKEVVCADTTYRHLRDKLVKLGVLELVRTDILHANVRLTALGFQVACIVKKFGIELNGFGTLN